MLQQMEQHLGKWVIEAGEEPASACRLQLRHQQHTLRCTASCWEGLGAVQPLLWVELARVLEGQSQLHIRREVYLLTFSFISLLICQAQRSEEKQREAHFTECSLEVKRQNAPERQESL